MPYFDWDAPRAREGYYKLLPGTDVALALRCIEAMDGRRFGTATIQAVGERDRGEQVDQHREFAAKLLNEHGVPELPEGEKARELLGWTDAGYATVMIYGAPDGFPDYFSPGPADRGLRPIPRRPSTGTHSPTTVAHPHS